MFTAYSNILTDCENNWRDYIFTPWLKAIQPLTLSVLARVYCKTAYTQDSEIVRKLTSQVDVKLDDAVQVWNNKQVIVGVHSSGETSFGFKQIMNHDQIHFTF